MQLTLSISINGEPITQTDKKRYTYESAVVSQIIADVNKRMTEIPTNDNNASQQVENLPLVC